MASTTKLVELFNADAAVAAAASTTAFVEAAYANLLNLSGDFSNKDERVGYWVGKINSGTVSKADFAATFLAAAAVKGDLLTNAEFAANTETLAAIASLDEAALTTLAEVQAALVSVSDNSNTTGQTFTLTNQTDNVVGTSKDDTFIGDNVSTSAGDTIVGGAGSDTLKIFASSTLPNFSGIETVYYNAPAGNVDLSAKSEVTAVQLDGFASNQVTLANGQTLKLANQAATTTATVAGNAVTALQLTLDAAGASTGDATVALSGTALTQLNVVGSNNASYVAVTNAGAKLDTINVSGDQNVALQHALTTVKTIDASAATGNVTIDGVGASNLAFTGGAGNDKIVMAATITGSDVLKGGEGTDTLSVSDADTIDTVAETAGISEFEIVEAAAADAVAYALAQLADTNTLTGLVVSTTGAGTTTVTGISNTVASNVSITGDAAATVVLTGSEFVSGGTSDTMSINFDNSVSKHADGVDVTTALTIANVDVLNIASTSDGTPTATVGGAQENSVTDLTATDLEKVVITGDEAFALDLAATTTGLTEVDASAMTSAAVNVNTDDAAITSILVKGGAKADTIDIDNAATVTSTIYTGGGSDTVNVVGSNGASHILYFTATELNSGDVKAGDAITVDASTSGAAGGLVTLNFGAEIEALLKVSGSALSAATANVNIVGTLGATTNVAASVDGTNAVLQFDLNGDGAYVAADDFQITLVGVAGGGNETLVYNAANDNFVFTIV